MPEERIYLGRSKEWGMVFLSRHSWDCGWYWGFGYLGNKDCHYHFESYLRGICHDKTKCTTDVKNVFSETEITQNQWWILLDLFKSAYALKEAAESYRHGGHMSGQARQFQVLSEERAAMLNADLKTLLDNIWTALHQWKQELAEKHQQRLANDILRDG